jgi:outer membrane receptor protein involved in Fe transport
MKARSRSGSVLVQIGKVCSVGSLALLSLARLNAQAPATPSAAASNEDVVRLSPFTVTTENDRGFQSGSVGTTARMKVDLADTPVSYSIINREMIDALGIVDMGEAAAWATNQSWLITDNGGMSNNSAQQYYQRGQTVSTGTANGSGAQRNSFQNASSINDSYNVESFDFGRGPNAALFGPGSGGGGLGGISSTQTKKARLEAPRTSISVVQGSWNYFRATVDYNRPLTERLGVRINAVAQDNDGWRAREFTHTRGLTAAMTWKITSTTDFTLEGSHEMRQAHSVGTGFDEYISGWDGITVFRGPITNAMLSTNATPGAVTSGGSTVFGTNPISGTVGLTWNGEPNGINRVASDFLVANLKTGTVMNYRNYPITRRADATSRVPVWSGTAPNGAYFVRFGPADALPVQGDAARSIQPSFGVGRMNQYSSNRQALPQDMYDRVYGRSKMREPSYRYTGTLDTPTTWSWTKDLQTTLTQRVGNNLYLDVSADINRVHSGTQSFDQPNNAGNPEGGRYVQLDINQLLPDGGPNPNFLEPYSSMAPGGREDWTYDQGVRLNAVYAGLDLGRWGRYDFNFQVGSSQRDTQMKNWAFVTALNADSRRWGSSDSLRFRVNWSDPVKTYYLPTSLSYTGNIDWTNANAPVLQPVSTIKPRRILGNNWSSAFSQDRYYLAHTQGKYFSNAVVLTLDYRRAFAFRSTKSAVAQLGYLPVGWDAATPYFRPDAPSDYFTMTYLQKNTATGVVTSTKPVLAVTRPTTTDAVTGLTIMNPFFVGDRFRNDYNNPSTRTYSDSKNVGIVWNARKWFAPYVNYSTSYTPPNANALDINFDRIKPQDSYGYDMGANIRLFRNNLTMRLNYYKNTRKNNTTNPSVQAPINSLYQSNRFDDTDATSSGRNAIGLEDLPGTGDYQDVRSDGREIEIGANLGGMRLTLNGGWGFTTNSNVAPLAKLYVPAHAADFLKVLQDAGGKLDTTQKPLGAPSAPGLAVIDTTITGPLLDQQQAINAYNNTWINYESLLATVNVRTPNQPTINGLVDYTLRSGAAKGLRLGAGLQWQGTVRFAALGSQTILDPNNPIPTAIDDPSVNNNNYSFVKGSYRTTATLAYTFQLKDRKSLALNLVITNPINDRGPVWGDQSLGTGFANFRQPAGDLTKPNRVGRPGLISRWKEPIAYKLTATYSFGGGVRR